MRTTLLLSPLLVCALSGCSLIQQWWHPTIEPIENPGAPLRDVAILPVSASNAELGFTWTQLLRGQLLRVEGVDQVRVVDPRSLSDANGSGPELPQGSQGLLHIKVLRFDPYYPPLAHLEVSFFAPQNATQDRSILTLDRNGTDAAHSGPVHNEPWVRFQTVYSADDPDVARSMESYAHAQGDNDRGLDSVDRIARVTDRYIDFVLYETLEECFGRIQQGTGGGQ